MYDTGKAVDEHRAAVHRRGTIDPFESVLTDLDLHLSSQAVLNQSDLALESLYNRIPDNDHQHCVGNYHFDPMRTEGQTVESNARRSLLGSSCTGGYWELSGW